MGKLVTWVRAAVTAGKGLVFWSPETMRRSQRFVQHVNQFAFIDKYSRSQIREVSPKAVLEDSLLHHAPNPNIWTGVIDYLESQGYRTDGASPNLFEFHYDWRKQLQHPSTFSALGSLIQQARTANPISKDYLTVVSLSAGGLLVKGYANSKTQAQLPHYIHTWISLGAPFQGSPETFASLLGEDHLSRGMPMGEVFCRSSRNIARMSSGIQTTLPTLDYNRIVYEKGNPRAYPNPRAFSNEWSGTFEQARTNPSKLPPDWQLDPTVFARARNFQTTLMGPTSIPRVYHIVNRGYHTLSKVTWHMETGIPLPRAGTTVNLPRFDFKLERNGDSVVPDVSLLAGDPHATYLEIYDTKHRDMADNSAVGQLAYLRAKNPHDTFLPAAFSPIGKASLATPSNPSAFVHTLVFQFKVYDFWYPANQINPPFPVTMELYDLEDGAMMVGTYKLLDNGNPTGVAATLSRGADTHNWASNDRKQQIWAVDLPADGNYRLVLLPSPDFWYPNDPDPGPFEIYGQLAVRDGATVWSAPPANDPSSPQIHFYGVNGGSETNFGFSAYRDYSIQGGVIQGGPGLVHIDANGDGMEDGTVTTVPEDVIADRTAPLDHLAIRPSPFRDSAAIEWSRTIGLPSIIEVYRIDGRRIRSATVKPHERSFHWDGRSDTGEDQPSGLYLVRLRDASGRALATQKVLRVQ